MKEPFRKIATKFAGLGLLWALICSAGTADVVILKDGHVLEGRVRRESFTEFDSVSKEAFTLPKGFFMVEDNSRRVIFGPGLVRSTEQKNPQPEEFFGNARPVYIPQAKNLPPIFGMKEIGKWNGKWDRNIKIFSPFGPVSVDQHLQFIGSRTVKIDSVNLYPWQCYYQTSELDRKMIDDLLAIHPEFQKKLEKGSPQSFNLQQKHAMFLLQADRLEDAIKKVEDSLSEFEGNKEFTGKLEEIRKKAYEQIQHVKIVQAKGMLAEGYFAATSNLLGSMVENQCSANDLLDLRTAKAKSEKELETHREIKAALMEINEELTSEELFIDPAVLEKFTKEVTAFDNPKFETFLSQFKQWKKQDKPNEEGEAEKLAALGLTGWALGNAGADPNPKSARRIWNLRQQLNATLIDMTVNRKTVELKELQKKFPEATTVDDLTVLLSSLGPINADPTPPRFPDSPTLRNFPETFGLPGGSYLIQVPQQYEPAMPAPVILILGAVGEKPADILIRWREHANREGFILAVPQWGDPNNPGRYQYSVKEHEILLASLRDIRARYRVDSDRVFLVGNLEGGQMAFDVGLSHPDLFAGVVPMAASPRFFAEKYWKNGVYLPFYVVAGDRSGEVHNQLTQLFTEWAGKGFNSLWVQYKGRGLDWFNGEIPKIVSWMKDKRRVFPLRALGSDGNGSIFGNEFRTMRPTDSQFYWLDAMDINPRNINSPPPQFDARISPATLYAKAEPEKNEVTIKTSGIKKLAFLIQRNSKGECCLNLDKPVTIRWNLNQVFRNQKIKIDMEMMLEDQARWQDRQRLLLSRLELTGR